MFGTLQAVFVGTKCCVKLCKICLVKRFNHDLAKGSQKQFLSLLQDVLSVYFNPIEDGTCASESPCEFHPFSQKLLHRLF